MVHPRTLIRWHRAGWKLFWRLKSRPGRQPIPAELRALIRRIANAPSWGEERIANELQLKIGIRVSPRTVNKYLPRRPQGRPRGDLRWSTFLCLHAQGTIACDFFVTVTATFRLLYVFVVIEHHSRRLILSNVTAHPSAAWTLQHLREAIGLEERYEYLLHDRDSIFAAHLDESVERLGVKVLRSPPRSPKANAVCERVIGTIRRECLDWLIPVSEHHLRHILKTWIRHYNGGRPHMSLGPGIPDSPAITAVPASSSRHRRGERYVVTQLRSMATSKPGVTAARLRLKILCVDPSRSKSRRRGCWRSTERVSPSIDCREKSEQWTGYDRSYLAQYAGAGWSDAQ